MNKYINEVKKLLYTDNGKVISSRFNYNFFLKNSFVEVWEDIHTSTNFLCDVKLKERLWYYFNNITTQIICKTCGRPTHIDFSYSPPKPKQYCSIKCKNTDPNLSKIIKKRIKNVDQSKAQEKRSGTMLKKYGTHFNSQREHIKHILSEKAIIRQNSPERLKILQNKSFIIDEYIKNEKPISILTTEIGGTDTQIISRRLKQWGIAIRKGNSVNSYEERLLQEFFKTLEVDVCFNQRILENKEADIYVPSKNIAVEYNGLFWHSSKDRAAEIAFKNKHLEKTNIAISQNIQLIHINSYEWLFKTDIVKSLLKAKLGITDRKIYARECNIVEIKHRQQEVFFNKSHIQGYSRARICYGLEYNGRIVCAMSFSKSRFDKKVDWELVRFANILNTVVVGGASKLFKHFTKIYNGSIVSYADRVISNGGLYEKLGFTLDHITKPKYYWTDGTILFNRTKFMKKNLCKKLKIYDEGLSETENMYMNRYKKYWDVGQLVYIYKINKN